MYWAIKFKRVLVIPKVKDLILKSEKSNIGNSTLFSVRMKSMRNTKKAAKEKMLGTEYQPHVPPSDIKREGLLKT